MINYDPTPEDGWLHTNGIYVRDSEGRSVAVRVITSPWTFPNTEFLNNAKAHGVNFINLHFRPPETIGDLPSSTFLFDFNNPTHVAQMDSIIDLLKQQGVYAILSYLQSSAALRTYGYDTAEKQATHVISVWAQILDHYKNEPTVVGIRILDEPHLGRAGEQIFWQQTIGNLRTINPNLLWFAHIICELRLGSGYWYLNPWQNPSEVPYPNIIMDGGMWISSTNNPDLYDPYYGVTTEAEAYARADEIYSRTIADMAYFRGNVGIPTGITPGIDDYYPPVMGATFNARHYLVQKLNRWMETNRYILTLYEAEYKLPIDQGAACFNTIFPDTPYPQYW